MALTALLLTAAMTSGAQQFTGNADFDSDLSGWAAIGLPAAEWAPFDPASMALVVGIEKTTADGSIQGYVDAVRIIYDPVFGDGFEPPPQPFADLAGGN